VISLVQRGRDYSKEAQRNPDRGSIPKESSGRGAAPRRELPFSIDFKGGEIVTLKWKYEH
jgi:hypothetical protein